MTIGQKRKKLFKVNKFQKNSKLFSLKIHKGAGIKEKPKRF